MSHLGDIPPSKYMLLKRFILAEDVLDGEILGENISPDYPIRMFIAQKVWRW
jgi:hypothetical protein